MVPTEEELLRIKTVLILKRNATVLRFSSPFCFDLLNARFIQTLSKDID
jgi:hypothetical protein